ncbi:hypothetical protein [Mycobacterium paraintracellulare]|uniref:hypothetical protein n=1 Tax=Mycobacterium paraintracellulare TaxID=1138383 RepID=UPI001915CE57|nr:hypothetical protein [Mycobacterium paraintracellulare]
MRKERNTSVGAKGGNCRRDPPGRAGLPTGEEAEALAARLTWIFADQSANATAEQRESVRRWQGRDRFYQQVQLAARDDPTATDEARRVADDLTSLAAPLTQPIEVWRGIRSVAITFGVPQDELHTLAGKTFEIDQFFATSVDRRVAVKEFTEPAPVPALYRVRVEAGTEAVWIPPLGAAEEARQMELLLLPGLEARILAVDESDTPPIVGMEVDDG